MKRTAVFARYAAGLPAERQEVQRNRAWRDLVERKFTGLIVTPGTPPTFKPESTDLKSALGIPR